MTNRKKAVMGKRGGLSLRNRK